MEALPSPRAYKPPESMRARIDQRRTEETQLREAEIRLHERDPDLYALYVRQRRQSWMTIAWIGLGLFSAFVALCILFPEEMGLALMGVIVFPFFMWWLESQNESAPAQQSTNGRNVATRSTVVPVREEKREMVHTVTTFRAE